MLRVMGFDSLMLSWLYVQTHTAEGIQQTVHIDKQVHFKPAFRPSAQSEHICVAATVPVRFLGQREVHSQSPS